VPTTADAAHSKTPTFAPEPRELHHDETALKDGAKQPAGRRLPVDKDVYATDFAIPRA
jgi:hypothetical protein